MLLILLVFVLQNEVRNVGLISHRPQVIQRGDWITFLENGKLKIQGTPAELRQIPGEHLSFIDNSYYSQNGLPLSRTYA
ncbi:hypothetical protein [Tolypothrix bouteillei]|uniref:Uncharacterized protein n=1 Tax=Tolypothrix bouteillei VB521301 TaxID=1479485 RepID=A0A0C1QR76_9CYAN